MSEFIIFNAFHWEALTVQGDPYSYMLKRPTKRDNHYPGKGVNAIRELLYVESIIQPCLLTTEEPKKMSAQQE